MPLARWNLRLAYFPCEGTFLPLPPKVAVGTPVDLFSFMYIKMGEGANIGQLVTWPLGDLKGELSNWSYSTRR